MTKLIDLATILRSKNAGPLYVTFDVMFDNRNIYERVKESGVLTRELISEIYDVDAKDVSIIMYDIVTSLKITIPRKEISGSLLDTDVYGCQQHVPLSNVMIP
ncbi:MAG: DUF4387 domain-containing protein [Clostridiales bacterium]|jgi:hypothetical protein|nr:DUF4387 domain-containing protein [Clostridiales bacterium]